MSWNFIAAECGRCGSIEDCAVSSAEYLVHLVRMNRLSAESFVVCIVDNLNGTEYWGTE